MSTLKRNFRMICLKVNSQIHKKNHSRNYSWCLKTTSIQRTCWHWSLDGMQSKITIVLLDRYLSSISVKTTFKVFRPINRIFPFIFTRFKSHDRVPQHRTRCAIIDYFLQSVTTVTTAVIIAVLKLNVKGYFSFQTFLPSSCVVNDRSSPVRQ